MLCLFDISIAVVVSSVIMVLFVVDKVLIRTRCGDKEVQVLIATL